MPSRRDDLFPVLQPPPGGLLRLRTRLAAETAPRPWRWPHWIAATMGVVAFIAIGIINQLAPPANALPFADEPAAVRFGVGTPIGSAVQVPASKRGVVVVQEVPTSSDDVIFYRIASIQPSRNVIE